MAGRKKSVSVQEELLLCPSAKPGDWFPGIPVSAVAGIDEAGRGCLAGPVVAAAVILPPGLELAGLNDSKKVSPRKREELFTQIQAQAVAWAVVSVDEGEIDRINILNARMLAMDRAIQALDPAPEYALIDGNRNTGICCPNETVVKGDGRSASIAAASARSS